MEESEARTFAGARPQYAGVRGGAFVLRAERACTATGLLADAGLSRAARGRLFARGQVMRADGAGPLDAQARLAPGEELAVEPRVTRAAGPASALPVRVLWEDDFALAVDKPQGILVHADGTGAPTLTDRVQGHVASRGLACVPQALQRLDVDTSGVVLFSKTEEFQPLFDALVAHGEAEGGARKTYLAVVRGAFAQERATYAWPLGRDRHDARRMRVSAGGQEALTHVRRLAISPGGAHSLLAVVLGTGRRHQIRVHLAHAGFPIVNDALYGRRESGAGLMLHAALEEFAHPLTGERVRACAGWPERFDAYFAASCAPELA